MLGPVVLGFGWISINFQWAEPQVHSALCSPCSAFQHYNVSSHCVAATHDKFQNFHFVFIAYKARFSYSRPKSYCFITLAFVELLVYSPSIKPTTIMLIRHFAVSLNSSWHLGLPMPQPCTFSSAVSHLFRCRLRPAVWVCRWHCTEIHQIQDLVLHRCFICQSLGYSMNFQCSKPYCSHMYQLLLFLIELGFGCRQRAWLLRHAWVRLVVLGVIVWTGHGVSSFLRARYLSAILALVHPFRRSCLRLKSVVN